MTNLSVKRAGELLRSVFEILWNKPDGLSAREILDSIPQVTRLSEDELAPSPNSNIPHYEKLLRIATIPIVQVGWLEKNEKGFWRITKDGYKSCSSFTSVNDFYQEALRLFNESRRDIPEQRMTIELAQESAWAQINKHLHNLNHSQLQLMLTELLRVLDFHPSWMAPPEKQRGKIDLILHTRPIGNRGERMLVQIIHKGQPLTLEGVRSFFALLGENDFGMIFSTGGFTTEALHELGQDRMQKITAIDPPAFYDLWEANYPQLAEKARRLLPLKAVFFLSTLEP